jgi:hypothetical protein
MPPLREKPAHTEPRLTQTRHGGGRVGRSIFRAAPSHHRLLLAVFCVLPLVPQAQTRIENLNRASGAVELRWQGGHGPYQVETSQDLANWSGLGDPAAGTNQTLSAFAERSFFRLRDLDPEGACGPLFGLLQTSQGEMGELMGRHRLKTRMWFYKTKGAPHTSASYAPANYWRKLLINYQYLEGGRVRTWSGPLEDLGAVATPSSQSMTITWTNGTGANTRTYLLTMEFPYTVSAQRSTPPNLSDPSYELKCAYATPQTEFDFATSSLSNTATVDTVDLVQLDPSSNPSNPGQEWWMKKYAIQKNGVQVSLHFFEGLPLYQGEPPWIFKTLILDRWLSPATASGGTLPALSTDSYFSRTLLPGHHNFYEMVLLEPSLDPALSEFTLQALKQANIRYIYTFKDLAGVSGGKDSGDILFFGYDNSVREP